MVRLSSPVSELRDHYTVVVVGSGYGGGIAASRLARAKQDVCVLERGREFLPGEFPDTKPEVAREVQADGPDGRVGDPTGLYDFRLNPHINVFVGCGLGGTSLVNANVAIRADRRVFEDAASWPAALRADLDGGLARGYERAEAMLRPTPLPADVRPRKTAAHEASARRLGARFTRLDLNVTFDPPAGGVNHVGVPQAACVHCGDCVTGCNHGAKNTVAATYLPDASNHGAQIFTQVAVRRVARRADGKWNVHYRLLGAGREAFDGDDGVVSADVVVLAAGTLGTTEILLRSRGQGLSLSGRLGERFTGNGDALAFGYNNDVPINGVGWGARRADEMEEPQVGPCITGAIDLRAEAGAPLADGLLIEEGALPGGFAGFVPKALAVAVLTGNGRDTDRGVADLVREKTRELESLSFGPYRGAVRHTQTYLVMAHDDGRGRMALEGDRLRVQWPGVGELPIFKRAAARVLDATAALGGTMVPNPLWTRLADHPLVTVHPLGGCVMADDAARGVVNHKGQVFAGDAGDAVHAGLYVCDGAVIPRPLGANPLLTISALAERAVALLAEDRGWTIDYALPSRPAAPPPPRPPGVEFTERMTGYVAVGAPDADFARAARDGEAVGSTFEFVLTISVADVDRLLADETYTARMIGTARAPALSPDALTVTDGRFLLAVTDPAGVETKNMKYRMTLTARDGRRYAFEGSKTLRDDPGLDVWSDPTTLHVTVRDLDAAGVAGAVVARGILRISPADFARLLGTIRGTGGAPAANLAAVARFGRHFAGTLYELYGGVAAPASRFDPAAPPRKKRPLRAAAPEVHAVETRDGVALRLTRYKGGARGPVLLAHGLGVSSAIFAVDTIETNLVEHLYAHGYDVWLLDYRSSIALPASRARHTGDDVAAHDWPAAVDAVRRITGADAVQVVAHCWGATTFSMAMLRGLQGVRSAVLSQVSVDVLASRASRIKAGLHLPDFLAAVGVDSLTAYTDRHADWSDRIVDAALRLYPVEPEERCRSPVCRRVTFLYAHLYEHDQLNAATHDALHELFGVASIGAFEHLARICNAGRIVAADGSDRYAARLDRLAIPIAFLHGAENGCFLPESTRRTYERLRAANGPRYTRHEVPSYGHLDCIFGKDAARDVYPRVVAHLDATA